MVSVDYNRKRPTQLRPGVSLKGGSAEAFTSEPVGFPPVAGILDGITIDLSEDRPSHWTIRRSQRSGRRGSNRGSHQQPRPSRAG
jgi:hypothetical protein